MKARHVTALAVAATAGLWIASGHFPAQQTAHDKAAARHGKGDAIKPFRVAVMTANPLPHNRTLVISGRTEADRHVAITARGSGVLTDLRVKRGTFVHKDDIVAILSDEAREAQVRQAQAVVTQKRTELEAKRAERKLAGIRLGGRAEVRLVTGERATGTIRFVAKSATQTTRTYRVEVELPNPDGAIPDGITAEVLIPQAPIAAARLPRSALTFSSNGELGVRLVGADDIVEFAPITVIEDKQAAMWVTGLAGGTRVIVQGQDFVREGQKVEPVGAHELTAVAQ